MSDPYAMLSSPKLRLELAGQAALENQQFEREQLDRQIAADQARERTLWNDHLAEVNGEPRVGALEAGLRAGDQFERDPRAPYGSPENPAVMVGGSVLDPKPVVPVARSRQVPELSEDGIHDLTRSRQFVNSDAYKVMVAEVRRFDQRRGY